MRAWLILLALVALACVNGAHQGHRTSRKKGHTSRKSHQRGLRQEQADDGTHKDIESDDQKAAMARFVVHKVIIPAIGTIASLKNFTAYTGVNVIAVSDVINGESTGVPYVYMSKDDFSYWDVRHDNHASLFFSRTAYDKFCQKLPLNAIDPKCGRAELFGKMVPVTNDKEEDAALKALTDKIPGLKNVKHENYVLRKMDIEAVFTVDRDSNPEQIDLERYMNAKPENYALADVSTRRATKRIG